MTDRLLVSAFVLSSLVSCSSYGVPDNSACELFQFEDGVKIELRSEAVKSLSARLEVGAPRHIMRMEIKAPAQSSPHFDASIEAVYISAFFRPLQGDEAECEELGEPGQVRCYAKVPKSSLQLSAVFDGRDSGFNASVEMRSLNDYMTTSVLNCR